MKSNLKYIERKTDGLRGVGKIARVTFSQTGKTIYCDGKSFSPLAGFALKANFFDEETYEEYWISNPRRDGNDSLFPMKIEIDSNAREEYWVEIRKRPEDAKLKTYKSEGKSKKEREKIEKAVRRHDMDRRFRAPNTGG